MVINQNGNYIFVPKYLTNQFVSYDDLYRPETKKKEAINIADLDTLETNVNKKALSIINITKILNNTEEKKE